MIKKFLYSACTLFIFGLLAQSAFATNYFVSSSTGSDTNSGTSTSAPWQSLSKVQNANLQPGDQVEFLRGDTWTGGLDVNQSGTSSARINFFGYGTASTRPTITGSSGDCLTVNGNFVTIDNLKTTACNYAGMSIAGNDVTIKNSATTNNVVGMRVVAQTVTNALMDNNTVTNNNVLNVNNSSGCSGAFGILLNGPGVVTHNTISGSVAPCQAYVVDGSGVEIYNGSNAWVHHNKMIGNDAGVEMGNTTGTTSQGNSVEYNAITANLGTVDTRPVGIIIPGSQMNAWVAHNSIRTSGATSQGIVLYGGASGFDTVRDNAVKADSKALFTDNSSITEGGNVWNGPVQGLTPAASDSTDPVGFVSDSDLHLTAGSPAIDRGTVNNFSTDLDGNPTPVGASSDSGAYEFQTTGGGGGDTTAPTTPTGLNVSGPTQTSLTLSWTASTDNVGVAGYHTFTNGTSAGDVTGTTKTFTGLTCGTTYTLGTQAFDAANNVSGIATAQGTTSACPIAGSIQHIVWVVMENKGYNQILNSSNATYIHSLQNTYGSATNMFAECHPSAGNYIDMTSGTNQGVCGNDNFTPQGQDNVFHQLSGGQSRSLEESMPSNCLKSNSGQYAVRHNPEAYYNDIGGGSSSGGDCALYDVPLGSTPNLSAKFTFITPNLCHDMHTNSGCGTAGGTQEETILQGDNFLRSFVPALQATPEYQAGNTVIFITWDEDANNENNHIPTIIIKPSGSHTVGGCQGTRYDHYSMLRYVEDTFGVSRLAGASTATALNGCFGL